MPVQGDKDGLARPKGGAVEFCAQELQAVGQVCGLCEWGWGGWRTVGVVVQAQWRCEADAAQV